MGLNAAWSMAVGGMIGGGIFAVLGVVVDSAGGWAWLSFLIAGLVALATGHSYARLTTDLDRGGGVYTFLHALGHERAAADLASILIVGYVLTMAVYAFTFSHYLAAVVGIGRVFTDLIIVSIIVLLVVVNLRGGGKAAGLEIVIVWGKVVILIGLALIGLWRWEPARLSEGPVSGGFNGALIGAAAVFMAYEGFQLLSYDYDDIRDAKRTLFRAILSAIIAVIGIYILVTLGATSLVGAGTIVRQQEIALVVAGERAMGSFGKVIVVLAAVFSTSSAINATLFATARLAGRVAGDGHLPSLVGHRNERGVPDVAITGLGAGSAVLAVVGGIAVLVQAASLIFLGVFALVNLVALRKISQARWISGAGFMGASIAGSVLFWHLSTTDVVALVGVVLLVLMSLGLRRLSQWIS